MTVTSDPRTPRLSTLLRNLPALSWSGHPHQHLRARWVPGGMSLTPEQYSGFRFQILSGQYSGFRVQEWSVPGSSFGHTPKIPEYSLGCRLARLKHRLQKETDPVPTLSRQTTELISQNVFINVSEKVNSPTNSSTYCLLLPIKMSS